MLLIRKYVSIVLLCLLVFPLCYITSSCTQNSNNDSETKSNELITNKTSTDSASIYAADTPEPKVYNSTLENLLFNKRLTRFWQFDMPFRIIFVTIDCNPLLDNNYDSGKSNITYTKRALLLTPNPRPDTLYLSHLDTLAYDIVKDPYPNRCELGHVDSGPSNFHPKIIDLKIVSPKVEIYRYLSDTSWSDFNVGEPIDRITKVLGKPTSQSSNTLSYIIEDEQTTRSLKLEFVNNKVTSIHFITNSKINQTN